MADYTIRVINYPQGYKRNFKGEEVWEGDKNVVELFNSKEPYRFRRVATYITNRDNIVPFNNLKVYLRSINAFDDGAYEGKTKTSEKQITKEQKNEIIENEKFGKKFVIHPDGSWEGGSRRHRRPSRKYKKSAKRVFRKKSRSTRRR